MTGGGKRSLPMAQVDAPTPRFDVEPSVSNHFSWVRTEMALQRTLMAAVRTAVSLIGFGFTVAQFFQRVRTGVPLEAMHFGPNVPRDLGLTLIGAGVVSASMFTWNYRAADRYLRSAEFQALTPGSRRPPFTSVYLIAVTVIVIGIVAFITVLIRL
jgi:putative membrane protein